MSEDSIDAHNKQYRTYQYRTPYGAPFFERVATQALIGRDSTLLDLCTGNGQIASGLAQYCHSIDAVDGAGKMLSLAIPAENVRYHQIDINAQPFRKFLKGKMYSHITVGRGIHWITDQTLNLLRDRLTPGGRFILLQSGFSGANVWHPEFEKVRNAFHPPTNIVDWTGRAVMTRCGYTQVERVSLNFRAKLHPEFLVHHAMSYSSAFPALSKRLSEFTKAMTTAMRKYAVKGTIDAVYNSSANIYQVTQATGQD